MLSIVLNVYGIDNIPLSCVGIKMIYRFRIITNGLNIFCTEWNLANDAE